MNHKAGLHGSSVDVRMRGFATRATVEAAIDWLDRQARSLEAESVSLAIAAGRMLAAPVVSAVDVPSFDRAMMDGLAIRAADVAGAGPYNQIALSLVGEAFPGRPFMGSLAVGQAVKIMTGAPMPPGADAVLPAELLEISSTQAFAHGEVPPHKHVGARGEDVSAGSIVLTPPRRLRPQDLGVLSSIGIGQVPCVRKPRVNVVITGSELLPAGSAPCGFEIADANGPMLGALVERDGGTLVENDIVADRRESIAEALARDADVVIVSGGSSVGQEDHVPAVLAERGELAIHGIAMRPSSPTGMGRLGLRLVFLLPGNPVSCLCAYDFFAGRAVRVLGGRSAEWPYDRTRGRLAHKLTSEIGRLDYARVTIDKGLVTPLAIGGASVLSSTTRADGFVLVPADLEGYAEGAEVEVFLY